MVLHQTQLVILLKKGEQMEVGSREDEEGTAILQVIFVCSRARDAVDDITRMDMALYC